MHVSGLSLNKLQRLLWVSVFVFQIHAGHNVCSWLSYQLPLNTNLEDRGCKILLARSGGVTHWIVTPDDDGPPMAVCWGQNAANGQLLIIELCGRLRLCQGELGLGPDEPKSATKPTRNLTLVGIDVFEYVLYRQSQDALITSYAVLLRLKIQQFSSQYQMTNFQICLGTRRRSMLPASA